jgi:aspartyl-tRNA(Asn)/glutamyl-tRNA(Gln) amidotransferase subunit A
MELALLSLEEVARKIAAKEVSPVEVTEALLARIERLNPNLNAYMTVTAESALDQARAAEKEIASGQYRGPLHGVPIAHKDLFDTKGVRTTAGMKIFADRIPEADAAVVEKLAAAGAVSLGKLGMHEAAYGVSSNNIHYGAVHNPWDLDRIPGGSSGGSGAATAAGLAFATTGSDTGGSIRVPAAFCGCVGLMPTYGRVSLRGAVPLSWTMDHAGPLTRTVRDAAIVLQAIAGHDPLDPTTVPVPVPDYLDGIERGPKGLRIGIPMQHFWDNLDAPVEASVRGAIEAMRADGATIVDVDWPELAEYVPIAWDVSLCEASAFHAPWFPSRRDEYSREVAALLDIGHALSGVRAATSRRRLEEVRNKEADAVLQRHGVDVLAVPTTPIAAPTIEAARAGDITGRVVALTGVIDFTGQPAIALPSGLTPEGLPASISFVGQRWDEAAVLRAARAWEQVRGDFPAPPIATS